ncbi:hypothetical protein OK074_4252 [Actinobacteria bacterium OK074]|nr:hypothetical protein OK074_4252 [Actinobacteria bacterium OK074]
MDYFLFTVVTDPVVHTTAVLLDRLRVEPAASGWSVLSDAAPEGDGTVKVRVPDQSSRLLVGALAEWFGAQTVNRPVRVGVRHSSGGEAEVTVASRNDFPELRRVLEELGRGEAEPDYDPVAPDNVHVTDEPLTIVAPDNNHVTPGPVIDPDDDWEREPQDPRNR